MHLLYFKSRMLMLLQPISRNKRLSNYNLGASKSRLGLNRVAKRKKEGNDEVSYTPDTPRNCSDGGIGENRFWRISTVGHWDIRPRKPKSIG